MRGPWPTSTPLSETLFRSTVTERRYTSDHGSKPRAACARGPWGKTSAVRRYETYPGKDGSKLRDGEVARAAERVTLACTALSSAVEELRIAHTRNKMAVVEAAARMVEAETERVCEMAEEVAKLASNLRNLPSPSPTGGPAER
jgi:hypothetical protein